MRCPACGGGDWTLDAQDTVTLAYAGGPRAEVRTGTVGCSCGRQYPVQDYVLSFAGRFGPELAREAAFWDRFYRWNLAHGAAGFQDLKRGFAPFLAQGVTEAFPAAATIDRYAVHYQVAEHPLLRAGTTLLDIGVGLGWTAIHFARAGYRVTAFDPSLGSVQAAKAYAVAQGVFIEYLCAAVGDLEFAPACFDNVTAFHALHHVPDLEAGLTAISRWLRPGGGLAVDEHIANSRLAAALGTRLHTWAAAAVFPRYRTIPDVALAALPQEPHSALEDVGVDQVAPLLRRHFTVEYEQTRHVVLDHYPLLYYLWQDRDPTAYRHSLTIANHLQELLRQIDPDGGEYLTLIAANCPPPARRPAGGYQGAVVSEIAAPPLPTPAHSTEHALIVARVAALEAELAAQGAWARGLETTVQERDRELKRLRAHLRRVANGRLLRLLAIGRRLWTGDGNRRRGGNRA